jgi:hypothetical protein
VKFNSIFQNNYELRAIRSAINEFAELGTDLRDIFDDEIEKFLSLNNLEEADLPANNVTRSILEHYLISILTLCKHEQGHTGWSKDSVEEFKLAVIRILEFVLFLALRTEQTIIDSFLTDQKSAILYEHFQTLSESIDEQHFTIANKNGKPPNYIIVPSIEDSDLKYSYRSSRTVQAYSTETNLFSKYFKLEDIYVERIFKLDMSENIIDGRNPQGVWGSRVPFKTITDIEKVINLKEIPKEFKDEPMVYHTFKNIPSPLLSEDIAKQVDASRWQQVQAVESRSPFKKAQISKAVGNSMVRNNLCLKADYNRPEIEHLRGVVEALFRSPSIMSDILLWSILLGVSVDKVCSLFLETDEQFNYSQRNQRIQIKHSGIFSHQIRSPEAYDTRDKPVYINLNDWLNQWYLNISDNLFNLIKDYDFIELIDFSEMQTELLDQDANTRLVSALAKWKPQFQNATKLKEALRKFKSELDEDEASLVADFSPAKLLLKTLINEAKSELSKAIAAQPVKVQLTLAALGHLNSHYYQTLKGEPTGALLMVTHKNSSEETQLSYCSVNQHLWHYEKWLIELSGILGITSSIKQRFNIRSEGLSVQNTDGRAGSRLYIKPGSYKNFLLAIGNIELSDELEKINMVMIVIRYMLCISLATRKATFSAAINDYSEHLKVLFLQEKAKNIFSSKRMIPLTPRALELIAWFERIKKHYKLHSNWPVLLEKDAETGLIVERDMSRKNISRFLTRFVSGQPEAELVSNFINHTNLNFGRHVFTSYTAEDSRFKQKHINAFLGHYTVGTEDQGIYSDFGNKEYIKAARMMVEEIEKIYFPYSVGVESYVP